MISKEIISKAEFWGFQSLRIKCYILFIGLKNDYFHFPHNKNGCKLYKKINRVVRWEANFQQVQTFWKYLAISSKYYYETSIIWGENKSYILIKYEHSLKSLYYRNCIESCLLKIEKETIQFITKTYLYNFGPLKPHFYIVKLGFTGGIHYFCYFCSKT